MLVFIFISFSLFISCLSLAVVLLRLSQNSKESGCLDSRCLGSARVKICGMTDFRLYTSSLISLTLEAGQQIFRTDRTDEQVQIVYSGHMYQPWTTRMFEAAFSKS